MADEEWSTIVPQQTEEEKIEIEIEGQETEQEEPIQIEKEEDRTSKRVLKAMDILADLLKAQENNDLEEAKVSAKLLENVIKQQGIE